MRSSNRNLRGVIVETVRAYCDEHYMRPYLWIDVDDACVVPTEYVTEGMIILDVDDEAVRNWEVTNEVITFEARFGDEVDPMRVVVPINRIVHVAPAEEPDTGASFPARPTHPDLREEILGDDKPEPKTEAPRRPMRIK